MKITKQDLIAYVAPAIIGIIIGLCLVKCASKPVDNIKIERDTVTVIDTVSRYFPNPVSVEKVRTEYKWLTRVVTENVGQEKNSVDSASFSVKIPQDSVLVEVPIESKHYHANEYDAWVSGYMPSLDSINVYQRTEYITERVTVSKPPNKWELDIVGGINYNFNKKKYTPHVGGELLYKPNRLQVGIRGGAEYTDKVEPVIGAVAKIRLY